MKRIKFDTIVPDEGEVVSHEEAFGVQPGEDHSTWKYFGTRADPTTNPIAICIGPLRYDHSERRILYTLGSGLSNALGGERDLILSTEPYAFAGSEANVAERHYGYKKGAGSIKAFCNDEDEVPGGPDQVYNRTWDGKRWIDKRMDDPKHNVWLKPHTDYYLTVRRLDAKVGRNNPPLSIYHEGGGDPATEHSFPKLDVGEELIGVGTIKGFEMDLGPLGTGLFIPDEDIE